MSMKIAVLGTGNLGLSIIKGILKSGENYQIIATRRNTQSIAFLEKDGIEVTSRQCLCNYTIGYCYCST